MRTRHTVLALAITISCTGFGAAQASAQSVKDPAKWAIDFGAGLSPSINGNVNSGAIGVYQGQTTAILPNSYGDVRHRARTALRRQLRVGQHVGSPWDVHLAVR